MMFVIYICATTLHFITLFLSLLALYQSPQDCNSHEICQIYFIHRTSRKCYKLDYIIYDRKHLRKSNNRISLSDYNRVGNNASPSAFSPSAEFERHIFANKVWKITHCALLPPRRAAARCMSAVVALL